MGFEMLRNISPTASSMKHKSGLSLKSLFAKTYIQQGFLDYLAGFYLDLSSVPHIIQIRIKRLKWET
jgi:hypothetical protein